MSFAQLNRVSREVEHGWHVIESLSSGSAVNFQLFVFAQTAAARCIRTPPRN
jgi:hypothetical protein